MATAEPLTLFHISLKKFGRIEDKNSETSQAGGVMLVPGVAKSMEEYKETLAKYRKKKELQNQQRKIDAPKLRKKEAALRETIALHKGTPEGDAAAAALAELTSSMEYLSNFYIKYFPEEEIAAEPPKKEEPPAKLPWDAAEWLRMPFSLRAEFARTHSEDVKPKPQRQLAPHQVYRRLKNPEIWSSVPWSQLPPDDPRLRDEPLSDGRYGK